jgi:GNAT superfamily N-acetyltransferase
MSGSAAIEIVDVTDGSTFGLLPPCADGRFDHRSCDYWEDAVRGSKEARPSWWRPAPAPPAAAPSVGPEAGNPFAPRAGERGFNPFAPEAAAAAFPPLGGDDALDDADPFATPAVNPFAPAPSSSARGDSSVGPRKLRLLQRGRTVFGSYAKVLSVGSTPAAYAQFGPLSAFPRAQHLRDLYPQLPPSPLPAVITCIATTAEARGQGLARRLVEVVCADLAGRGFAAVEAYPDLTLGADATSSAHPDFWRRCGFESVVEDERFPVMRRELE